MSYEPVLPPATEYLFRKATASGVPLSGTFELTPVCNMDCKMCYVRMSRQQQESIRPLRTADEWLSLAREAKQAGMLYLLLTGGEPFSHPQFRQILTGLHQMGLIISINSNGTLINEETVAWLKEVPPCRINITLYGASNDTYKNLCGNPHGFTQTDTAIRLLREARIPVRLNCSMTPYNCDDLPAIIDYANSMNLAIQTTAYMFPPTRKDVSSVGRNNRFTPEEAAYYTSYNDLLLYGKDAFLARSDAPVIPIGSDDECIGTCEGVRCRAGRSSFWITWEGMMLPCGMFPSSYGSNVFLHSFIEGWTHTKHETNQIRLPAKCTACTAKDICRACAAMVITESGRFDTVPQYRCEMTRSLPVQQAILKRQIQEGSL